MNDEGLRRPKDLYLPEGQKVGRTRKGFLLQPGVPEKRGVGGDHVFAYVRLYHSRPIEDELGVVLRWEVASMELIFQARDEDVDHREASTALFGYYGGRAAHVPCDYDRAVEFCRYWRKPWQAADGYHGRTSLALFLEWLRSQGYKPVAREEEESGDGGRVHFPGCGCEPTGHVIPLAAREANLDVQIADATRREAHRQAEEREERKRREPAEAAA